MLVIMILALYLRLSKEDMDAADESNSITNQRKILRKYIEQRPEFQGFIIKEYVDDGYSGRNFERPAMRELLEEVKAGKVYGIIVKDFSRFGRNFIEVGDYVEKIFPMLGVRFIAVNNQFDSITYEGITPDMDVSFQNLMYDYFSAENSVKIKNDLLNRRKRGKFLGTSAPLGYVKSPQDHNQLIIESEAAEIVKLIFELYDECGVKAEVARYLNANHIPTPLEYAVQKGRLKRWRYSEEKKFWSGAIVGKILKNEIYIGNTVFRKSEVQEPASSKRIFFSKKDWEIYENAHEPIISKELFEWVNSPDFISKQEREKLNGKEAERIEQRNRKKVCGRGEKHKAGSTDSPLKGFVKCGGCRHTMVRRNRLNASYYCRHYYEIKKPGCCSENVKEAELIEIVKNAICKQAVMAVDLRKVLDCQRGMERQKQSMLEKQKKELQRKILNLQNENFSLYEKYKAGEFSREEYMEQRQKYQKSIEWFQNQLDEYEKTGIQEKEKNQNILELLKGREQIKELTREMVEQLVSKIYVYGNNRVEIIFKFQDELAILMDSAEGYKM